MRSASDTFVDMFPQWTREEIEQVLKAVRNDTDLALARLLTRPVSDAVLARCLSNADGPDCSHKSQWQNCIRTFR